MELDKTKQEAKQIRRDIIDMTHAVGTHGAHIGGSLSAVELFATLYFNILRYDKNNMISEDRDRFILSKGHAAMTLYATLHRVGVVTDEEIKTFKGNGSKFANHPYMYPEKGVEFSSGSLGHGLSLGVGTALALQHKGNNTSKVFVYQGDGECDEGSVWEAAMSASHYGLNNLILIIDRNKIQLDGFTEDIMSQAKIFDRFKSFGWEVNYIDGHDIDDIYKQITTGLANQKRPLAFIANTIKGKGVSFIENRYEWHIGTLNDKLYNQAIEELNNERNQ